MPIRTACVLAPFMISTCPFPVSTSQSPPGFMCSLLVERNGVRERELPDFKRLITGRGDHVAAVWSHCARRHQVRVTCESGERAPGCELPDFERLVPGCRDHMAAVW